MTQYVVVSDIHANYPALQSVVDTEGKNKEYLVLGDILGLNAYPSETVSLLQELQPIALLGNHDVALIQKDEGHVNNQKLSTFEYDHTIDRLSQDQISWLNSLNSFETFTTESGKEVCLTHAMPWPEESSGYTSGNAGIKKGNVTKIAAKISDMYDFVFHGHTHTQYTLDCSKFNHPVIFTNPGSLGWDNKYATFDSESETITLKEIDYETDIKQHIQELLPEDAPDVHKWY